MHPALTQASIIIWDWNGTLIDDVDVCIEIINRSLKKRGLPLVDRTAYLDLFEFPVINYYRRLGFDFEKETFQDVGLEFINGYAPAMFTCPLHNRARDLLAALRAQGKRQFILSALEAQSLHRVIHHFQLESFFTDKRGLDHHYATSKIDLGKSLLSDHAHDPREAVMIGDTLHDFETAQELGISSVLVAAGHNSRERLEKTGTTVVASLVELLG